jgi:flagellar capping protein FliD
MEILAQQAGLQPLATQLSTMSSTAQRIEALQTALRMERQQLAKDIADLTKTVDEQEKAITKYFETIRQEMKRLGTYISDKNIAQTEAKVEQNAPPSEEKIKHEQTIPPPEVRDKQTDITEQSRPTKNTKEPPRDDNTLRQERTEEEDIRMAEHTRED